MPAPSKKPVLKRIECDSTSAQAMTGLRKKQKQRHQSGKTDGC